MISEHAVGIALLAFSGVFAAVSLWGWYRLLREIAQWEAERMRRYLARENDERAIRESWTEADD